MRDNNETNQYFWKDSQVVDVSWEDFLENDNQYLNCFCIDNFFEQGHLSRYGVYEAKHQQEDVQNKWVSVPFEDFPHDFRMALLLLGIT